MKITNKSKLKIVAYYESIKEKYANCTLEELKALYGDKTLIKGSTAKTAIVHLVQQKQQEEQQKKIIESNKEAINQIEAE